MLAITTYGSRLLGFSRADEVTIVFCGSKKSLASGLPMATVLLAGQSVGLIVLPLMLFHQIQLMVCAVLARRAAQARPPIAASRSEPLAVEEFDDLAVRSGDEGDANLGGRLATQRRGPRGGTRDPAGRERAGIGRLDVGHAQAECSSAPSVGSSSATAASLGLHVEP